MLLFILLFINKFPIKINNDFLSIKPSLNNDHLINQKTLIKALIEVF